MALPHVTNSQAHNGKWDPVHKSIFEVQFSIPTAIQDALGDSLNNYESLLTEHVLSVGGMDTLYKGVEAEQQKFMGVSRSYLKPTIGDTFAEIIVKFSLNLRNDTDNYIYRVFNEWKKLGYDLQTGQRNLKRNYVGDFVRIKMANRDGSVFHIITLKNVILTGAVQLTDGLDYTSDDALELEVKFRADWWEEKNAPVSLNQ